MNITEDEGCYCDDPYMDVNADGDSHSIYQDLLQNYSSQKKKWKTEVFSLYF